MQIFACLQLQGSSGSKLPHLQNFFFNYWFGHVVGSKIRQAMRVFLGQQNKIKKHSKNYAVILSIILEQCLSQTALSNNIIKTSIITLRLKVIQY